ncbi:hypothetical protein LZD57_03475 [Jiella sp. CBK1P-4]|uniref:Uncharacterized protein n=1 Tax=Jiella avicenniae TaxID=2907202 RepID=A0A9X1T341_9HYPH|nr:hypothetical protein [Jiella avicenniae]MCE7027041.1 hypothetical protein [Jiella avicenniae]
MPELLFAAAAGTLRAVPLRPVPADHHEARLRRVVIVDPLQKKMAAETAAILSLAPSFRLVARPVRGAVENLEDRIARLLPVKICKKIASDDLQFGKPLQALRALVPTGNATCSIQQDDRVIRHALDEQAISVITQVPVGQVISIVHDVTPR